VNKIHHIQDVKFEEGNLLLTVDGTLVVRKLADVSLRLVKASDAARKNFTVAPSGYGIHWPDCDEDLSVDALLGIQHAAPMMAAENSVEYLITHNH
jgi:hypothetical protein